MDSDMGSTSGVMKRKRSSGRARRTWRRPVLAVLALSAVASPAVSGGCIGGFDAPSDVNALRVLAVELDKPYAQPGDEVKFSMSYHDGLGTPEEGQRPVQITWIGGCFDPIGDQYFGCFQQFANPTGTGEGWLDGCGVDLSQHPEYLAQGTNLTEYTLKIPDKIVSCRPPPASGPHYGLAYIFFAACAGELKRVDDQGTGAAGTFPFGCFDSIDGRRLGAESFVPGYTQVYVFGDGRTNKNPEIKDLTMDGERLSEDFEQIGRTSPCAVTDEERRSSGCGSQDPFTECTPVEINAVIDPGVGESDPDSKQEKLSEIVWVNYYADQGDLDRGIKLVNDAVQGYNDEHSVKWIPPSEPGVASIWAVVRDARGGTSVLRRFIRVE